MAGTSSFVAHVLEAGEFIVDVAEAVTVLLLQVAAMLEKTKPAVSEPFIVTSPLPALMF